MGIAEAKALLDQMDAGREKFIRDLGGPDVLQWLHQELRRRHEAREARERLEQQRTTPPPETTPSSPPVSEASLSLTRRVEVLEAQLKHLARKLERAQGEDLREWAMTDSPPPWKRKNPKKKASRPLTAEQKGEARARARKAGRKYPNLVDNMAVARKSRKKTGAKKKSSR